MANELIPNKDFTFVYTTENYQLPSVVYGENDIGSTAIVCVESQLIDDKYQ